MDRLLFKFYYDKRKKSNITANIALKESSSIITRLFQYPKSKEFKEKYKELAIDYMSLAKCE
jgi:hypothetical protein